jgi:O-antigen/teichoic acid export membrane protein
VTVRRSGARDTTALAVGSAANGLLAYVFFSLVTHAIGSVAAAPVSVLWTYWAAAAAVLTFPLQHWLSRTVAVDEGETGVRAALPGVVAIVAALAFVAAGLAWLGRTSLFHRGDLVFPLLIGGVTIGSGFVGVVRGMLTARTRFAALATALAAENGARCVGAVALSAAGVNAPAAYGAVLLAGQLIGFAWPSTLRPRESGEHRASEAPLAFLGNVAGGSLIGQLILTGGPVLLALRGGSAAQVTALFAALALFRAPYTLSLGVVAQVTGRLTGLVTSGRHDLLRRIRLAILVLTAACAAVGAVVGAGLGPWLVRGVFGADVRIGVHPCAIIGAASAVAIANLVTTLSLIARARAGAVLRSWLVASAAGAVVLVFGLSPVDEAVTVFAVAEAVAFAVMVVEEPRQPVQRAQVAGR